MTFGQFADAYVEQMRPSWKNAKHADQWTMTLTRYCRPIRSKLIKDITTEDVLQVLNPSCDRHFRYRVYLRRARTSCAGDVERARRRCFQKYRDRGRERSGARSAPYQPRRGAAYNRPITPHFRPRALFFSDRSLAAGHRGNNSY